MHGRDAPDTLSGQRTYTRSRPLPHAAAPLSCSSVDNSAPQLATRALQAKAVETLLQAYIMEQLPQQQQTGRPDTRLQEILLAVQHDPKYSLPYAQYR